MKTAAVCIATYRRDEGVLRLIGALKQQRVPEGWRMHVRVVNNDPDADMLRFRRAVATVDPDALVTQECERNIASARNAALNKGPAEAFLFIDDDELPTEGWFASLVERIGRADADAVFGPVAGRPAAGTAKWLIRSGAFDKLGPDHDGAIPWTGSRTSSTAVEGSWFNERGFRFDPGFGRSGGSDVELFRRMAVAGARLVHERRGLVYEDVEPDRCNWRAVLRRRYRAGVVLGKMERESGNGYRWYALCKRVGMGSLIAAAGTAGMIAGRPGRLFHGVCKAAVGLGAWRGYRAGYTVTRYPDRVQHDEPRLAACA